MQVLLEQPGVKKLFEYEDGHILDLAAANGHLRVVQLLIGHDMPVGPGAMAHAAHYNHTEIMSVSTLHSTWYGDSPAHCYILAPDLWPCPIRTP